GDMSTQHTALPWTPATILHIALAKDVDFAVRAVNNFYPLLDLTEKLAILAETIEGGESPSIFYWLKVRDEARDAIERAKEAPHE
ncbi:hypothetical protein LCGC14_1859560, partial [marine sediment metagenome]